MEDINIMSKQNKRHGGMYFETVVVIIIALCLIFLNYFTVSKINELQRVNRNSIFIDDDLPLESDGELVEELKTYMKSPCKMIELYDEDMNLMFQVTFDSQGSKAVNHPNGISKNSQLSKLIGNQQEGQATIKMHDRTEQDIYYKWISNSKGERRLIIIYNEIFEVKGIWVFSFVCYIILILVFVLLIRLHIVSGRNNVSHYADSTNYIKHDLN